MALGMADDSGDKTEAPTPRRRAEAREQGNVARSADLSGAVIIIGVMMILNSFGSRLVGALKAILQELLGEKSLSDFSTGSALDGASKAMIQTGAAMMPLLAGVVLIAILSNVVQVGFHFNGKKLQPNLGALNPF